MNFINAIQHATIGYGIRRRAWRENDRCWLTLDNFGNLQWCEGNVGGEARLIPIIIDPSRDMIDEDIRALDWEAV
jgi:hypothetical protein